MTRTPLSRSKRQKSRSQAAGYIVAASRLQLVKGESVTLSALLFDASLAASDVTNPVQLNIHEVTDVCGRRPGGRGSQLQWRASLHTHTHTHTQRGGGTCNGR